MQTYKIGDSVKVIDGIADPDFPELMLSGWQGRVLSYGEQDEDTGEILVEIAWDSITLKNMPPEYIKKCFVDGLDWASCSLFASEVSSTTPRDTEDDVEEVIDFLSVRYEWSIMGEAGELISEVLKDANTDDDEECYRTWHDYLTKHLSFPFDAIVSPDFEGDFVQIGQMVKVRSFANIDDIMGVMVKIEADGKTFNFPLSDLEIPNELSDNFNPTNAYATWYANM